MTPERAQRRGYYVPRGCDERSTNVDHDSRYPGMRVPRPIEVTEHYGSAPLDQLCREILALTKMDWNSANFAAKAPITTEFAADVGRILLEVPTAATPQQSYRFYM